MAQEIERKFLEQHWHIEIHPRKNWEGDVFHSSLAKNPYSTWGLR